jgi:hypothetical protein
MDVSALVLRQPVDLDQAIVLAAVGLAGGDRRRQLDRGGVGQFVPHRVGLLAADDRFIVARAERRGAEGDQR